MSELTTDERDRVLLELYPDHVDEARRTSYTCDNCDDASDCAYAFDLYNQDGDCLAEK